MSARSVFVCNLRVLLRPFPRVATRTFVSSTHDYKTVTDAVKDAAKTVDKTVSKAAIKGLDGVEKVTEVTKDAAKKVGIKTDKKTDDLDIGTEAAATKAQGKVEQVKRDAKEGIRDTADKFKHATR